MGSASKFSCVVGSPHTCAVKQHFSLMTKAADVLLCYPWRCHPGEPLISSTEQGQPFWWDQWFIKHQARFPSGASRCCSPIFTQASLYVLAVELALQSPSTVPVLARILGCWQGLAGLFNGCWGCWLPHAIHSCSGSQSLNHLLFPKLLSQLCLQ